MCINRRKQGKYASSVAASSAITSLTMGKSHIKGLFTHLTDYSEKLAICWVNLCMRAKGQRTNGDVCRTRVHQQRQKMKKSQWTSVKVQLVQTLSQCDSDQMSKCDSCCHWHRFFGRSERQCSHKRSQYKFNYRFFSLVLTSTRRLPWKSLAASLSIGQSTKQ